MASKVLRGRTRFALIINGKRFDVKAHPMKRLLDVLREDCTLTGTKEGCGEGECGACTVLLEGQSVNSCLVPVAQADGARILTVEGLTRGRALTALQRAFVEMGGAQCGICTPGMLVSAHELLRNNPNRIPADPEIREALAGNLCRCTGYKKIVDAVRAAARARRAASGVAATRRRAGARRKGKAAGRATRRRARGERHK